jgi:hypothetical protein
MKRDLIIGDRCAMATFDDRKKGFEEKFRHDQELQFKVNARRNKLFGLWAAERLGLTGDAAESYAKEVVAADFQKPGDDDVVQKVVDDLKAKNVAMSEAQVRDELRRLLEAAKKQIIGG